MKAFYSDTFVLPLPEQHRFPMAKYRLLRERLVEERILSAGDLHVPEPIAWDDLRLVHDAAYVGAVANGTLTADAQRRIGFPWSPMMVERSRRSAGATLAAAREVLGIAQGFGPARGAIAANLAELALAGQRPTEIGPRDPVPRILGGHPNPTINRHLKSRH